ncbi:Polyketide cyclase / dehydrase and lipid transport [Fulvimarina manganoxydans]|uniref:Polyketide cyclase / dehydrase and lipid transport n=1 Tax=Fulvimarina manganoxydans TaxID=937218 RepID=A0A1W2E731_9HYPH|nr:SRPBCC family protein [Fulvimarina manganoxydans]SMD05564.1 Polyketide cyclase / dehydrase and lipid transport [Fulvimarina manganoxydans]
MKSYALPLAAFGFALAATPAFALGVEKSTEVAASPDTVWQVVGDFCAIGDWHPAVESCEDGEADGKERRTLTLKGGGTIVEELVSRDDAAHTYTYRIVESPLPVANYESTISVSGEGDTATLSWSGTFDAANATDEEAENAIGGIYDAGIQAIAEKAKGM